MWTDDPVADFARYDRQQAMEEDQLRELLPTCAECYRTIEDDECWEWNGEIICEECAEENHHRKTMDFVGV